MAGSADMAPREIDSSVPHSARIWNYWLGGKDFYDVDRQVGDGIARTNPGIVTTARAQRAFLCRAVRHLAGDNGIRQFLDIGTGLPTVDNTHEVAQRVAPDSRIVYVDHDPLVLTHARALLTSTPEGVTQYIDADLRDPDAIVQGAARTLDFDRPVALMLLGIVAHITDDSAYGVVGQLMDALPSGSYLVFSDSTEVVNPEAVRDMVRQWNRTSDNPRVNRTRQQIERFFEGLEILEPGLVSVSRWRPEALPFGLPDEVDNVGAVAYKP
ncbi:SAM-dependent methyltransferase [Streptomyces iconiensis]|uniref:SAM-dependent methyltransferase n=1 Tax=Streptomyces iconiensis TaxID=1384038 RepID=A0ABT7A7F6_9ACTN|nr:SAM-dependent methyltransferase [Streptomyces iconiensis]MDJ1137265.1 SAM-dependent methyltransferase [Streptomyces iconiensis]